MKKTTYRVTKMAPPPAKAAKHGTETPRAKKHMGYAADSKKSKS